MDTLDISSDALIRAANVDSASAGATESPQALAEIHENWKNEAHTKRQAFFGAHYSPEMDSATFDKKFIEMGRGLEPAALAFVTQGLSSAITFGTRGGVATSLKGLGYSAGAAGAMAGLPMGVANFLAERLVLAPINHASKQMKRPALTLGCSWSSQRQYGAPPCPPLPQWSRSWGRNCTCFSHRWRVGCQRSGYDEGESVCRSR
jgi:hypothetical protein